MRNRKIERRIGSPERLEQGGAINGDLCALILDLYYTRIQRARQNNGGRGNSTATTD